MNGRLQWRGHVKGWCNHKHMVPMHKTTKDGRDLWRAFCPMCMEPEIPMTVGVNEQKARETWGNVRVDLALDQYEMQDASINDRLGMFKKYARRVNYEEYLLSPMWKARRVDVLTAARFKCQRCFKPATDVHHKTYANLFNEPTEDLEALCRECHEEEHSQTWWQRGFQDIEMELAEESRASAEDVTWLWGGDKDGSQ